MRILYLILFNLCLLFLITGCVQKFKYSGDYPDYKYLNMYSAEEVGELRSVDEVVVPYRNRIYLTVDRDLEVSLNGYPVDEGTFLEDFKYIYTNPDQSRYLPESPEKAVIFYATDLPEGMLYADRSMEQERRMLEIGQLQNNLRTVVQQLRENYSKEKFGVPLFGATDQQVEKIEKMYPVNLAIYSSAYAAQQKDQGIAARIPPWGGPSEELKERNVIKVRVDKEDKLFLRDQPHRLLDLKDTVKAMISNPYGNSLYPEKSNKAIVSLSNERDIDYQFYLKVYNALKAAYDELREEEAQLVFGKAYTDLDKKERTIVVRKIPFALSESEPTAFDGE